MKRGVKGRPIAGAGRVLALAIAAAVLALCLAAPAFGAFPYTGTSGDPLDFNDLFLGNETPGDLAGDDNDWKFAATDAGPSNAAINSNPVELQGIRGAHVADATDAPSTAWETTLGRPDVTIAVMDSGIKWNDAGAMSDLRLKVRLNTGELPPPEGCLVYDCDGNGVVNVADYEGDSRVDLSDSRRDGPGGVITPQDLLIAFSDGSDADGNGYADDIAGWDFLDNDNDAFDDVQYGHGTGEARDSSSEADNGGQAGTCPNCTFIPLRVGDSFVADVDRFAAAVTYATDNGVLVVQEALGTLNNSSLARDAVNYAYGHGVTVIASAADEAAQHNNWPSSLPHVILVNSVVRSAIADGQPPPISYLALNGCTNFNAKITLAIPSDSCSSNATGLAAGMAGLVYSAALSAKSKGALTDHPACLRAIDGPDGGSALDPCLLSANEVRQIMASGTVGGTPQADDVDFAGTPPGSANEPSCSPAPSTGCTDPNGALRAQTEANRPALIPASTSYPARLGHDQFYGYGRANMDRALKAVLSDPVSPAASKIPPEAELDSPTWYEPVDPARAKINVTGQVFARGGGYSCMVYVAPGHYPNNRLATDTPPGDYHPVPSAGGACDGSSRTAAADGLLAQIDTATLKSYFPPETQATGFTGREPGGGAQTSSGRPNTDPYGFVVRVKVTAAGLTGEDQRAAFLHRDQDLLGGFPKEITGGGQIKGLPNTPTGDGESSPALADLNGDNRNELIFASSDGFVHALEPDGSELPGWPVRGDRPAFIHTGSRAFASGAVSANLGGAILASVAVGDTDRNGIPEVYAADLEGKLYGWNPNGNRIFEQESNPAFGGAPLQPFTEPRYSPGQAEYHRTQHGFIGSPVLADLDGNDGGRLEIVAAGMDRHVYAWNGNGSLVDTNDDDDPDYPVLVVDPAKVGSIDPTTNQVTFAGGSNALMQGAIVDTPALADLSGDERPEIVIGTNEEYDEPINAGFSTTTLVAINQAQTVAEAFGVDSLVSYGNSRVFALSPDGDTDADPDPSDAILPGWPFAAGIVNRELLPVVGEGITGSPAVATIDCPSGGSGPKVGVLANNGPGYILNADGTSCYGESSGTANPLATDFSAGAQRFDTPAIPAVGHPAFGAQPTGTTFFAPAAGLVRALDVVVPEYQQGQDFTAAWNPATGQFQPGFPAPVNDLQFLTGPSVADIDGVPGEEVLEGTASKDLAAFDAAGAPASPNWPKVSTDWTVTHPLIGTFDTQLDTSSAATRVVIAMTRSGYIDAYRAARSPLDGNCGPGSWPRFHHDNANSGDFSRDAVLPGKPLGISLGGTTTRTLTFTAPGDDLMCGAAEGYEIRASDSPIDEDNFDAGDPLPAPPSPAAPGTQQQYQLPAGTKRYVAIRAVDEQGNVGRVNSVDQGGPAPVDSDGDGIPDDQDDCPSQFGPPSNNGCPDVGPDDSDGDGVANDQDQCPSEPGPASNQGCPEGASGPERCSQTISGTPGDDRLHGTGGSDRILGLGGDDRLLGLGGNDCLLGAAGGDRLKGGSGMDLLKGGSGADRLAGGPNKDLFKAGKGADRIFANDGEIDFVRCGPGHDRVNADPGDRLSACERVKRKARPGG